MAAEIPQFTQVSRECSVLRLTVAKGDRVSWAGCLAELQTTGGTVPVFATQSGIVRWTTRVGESVQPATPICYITPDNAVLPVPIIPVLDHSRSAVRAVMIVPYFGRLPNWFPIFARGCEFNPWLDVKLLTDVQDIGCPKPPNLEVISSSLREVANHVHRATGLAPTLPRPYKLCDLKPFYAELFPELIAGYEWWGWGDLDVLYGDLLSQLKAGLNGPFAMVLTQGSLCLNRNVPFMQSLYRTRLTGVPYFEDVLRNPVSHAFDETPGYKAIAAHFNLPVFRSAGIADIDATRHRLTIATQYSCETDYDPQMFVYRAGRLYREAWHDGQFLRREFGYIHLQKRRFQAPGAQVLSADAFAIGPDRFEPIETDRPSPELMRRINPGWPIKDLRFKLAGPIRRVRRLSKEAMMRAFYRRGKVAE